jgi:hypothetical protein
MERHMDVLGKEDKVFVKFGPRNEEAAVNSILSSLWGKVIPRMIVHDG